MKKVLTLLILLYSIHYTPTFGQWTAADLSEGKTSMGATVYDSKVYFGGGATNSEETNRVEIYDLTTGKWTVDQFSIPREFVAATAAGGKVFFAGGIDFFTFEHFSRVDIFDIQTQVWATAELSAPKFDVAAVSYGDRVFFAGGVNLATGINDATIDIYHISTGDWTSDSLSEAGAVRAAVSGSKIAFVGVSLMDVYDADADEWMTIILPEPRLFTGVAASEDNLIIAGGMNFDNTPSDRVDIYNLTTGEWSVSNLSVPRAFLNNAATVCGKAFFAGGGTFDLDANAWTSASDRIDIFDPMNGEWTTDQLSHAVVNHVVVAGGDRLLSAGGVNPADVSSLITTVDIYSCDGISSLLRTMSVTADSAFPNPTEGFVRLHWKEYATGDYLLTVSDPYGRVLQRRKLQNLGALEPLIDLSDLPAGMYLITISNGAGRFCMKVVKQGSK